MAAATLKFLTVGVRRELEPSDCSMAFMAAADWVSSKNEGVPDSAGRKIFEGY